MSTSKLSSSHRTNCWVIGFVIGAAALIRIVFATRKSFVLDEFHSYFHATRDSVAGFFGPLILDNHPPLSFAIIAASRALFGESEFALRLPAIVYGLLELWIVARIAKRIGLTKAPALAVALLAASSLHLDFSTQARMYALHALAVTGLVEALLSTLAAPHEPIGKARFRVGLWLTVGLLNHYFFIQYGFWIALAGLIAMRGQWQRLKCLITPTLVAIALVSPWYLTGFREQLAHQLPPGGANIGLRSLAEAFVHMFYLNVRIGGPLLRIIFIASGALATIAAGLGFLKLYTNRSSAASRTTASLLGTVAFLVPIATTLTAAIFTRAGFTWHYVLPSAAALALLAAVNAERSRLGRILLYCLIASALLLSILNAKSTGTEDYRAAVRTVAERFEPGDAVISVEWQPPLFPQGQPWNYYSKRLPLNFAPPPTPLAMDFGFNLAHPTEIAQYHRIWVLSSYLPSGARLLRALRTKFTETESIRFGFQPTVLLFERQ